MVLDGLRGYLQLANGLTDVTRERARLAAKSLVAQGEASMGAVVPDALKTQVSSLTEDLIATSKANRSLLVGLVSSEVERATARLGLAMAGELEAAKRRAQRLEQRVSDLEREVRGGGAAPAPSIAPAPKQAAKKSPARARKTAAKKTAAKKTATKRTAAKKTPAKRTAAVAAPIEAAPVVATPVQTPPMETAPVDTVETAPAAATPVETVDTTPTAATPVETAPAEAPPAEPTT